MGAPSELRDALNEIIDFLRDQKWKHCLIGGLAASYWGRARATQDVDPVVLCDAGHANGRIE